MHYITLHYTLHVLRMRSSSSRIWWEDEGVLRVLLIDDRSLDLNIETDSNTVQHFPDILTSVDMLRTAFISEWFIGNHSGCMKLVETWSLGRAGKLARQQRYACTRTLRSCSGALWQADTEWITVIQPSSDWYRHEVCGDLWTNKSTHLPQPMKTRRGVVFVTRGCRDS